MSRHGVVHWSLAFAVLSALSVAHAQAEADPCRTASGTIVMIPECMDLVPDDHITQSLINSFNNREVPTIDEVCGEYDYEHLVYLNHTIHNGELKGVCYGGVHYNYSALSFEIEAADEGYLILDIPHDLFISRNSNGYDQRFTTHVYSTEYTTYEYVDYVDRKYFPLFREETSFADWTDDNRCLSRFDKTCDELWEDYVESVLDDYPLGIQHMLITKVGSFETFDRYKFPFLKDDYFFDLARGDETMMEPNVQYEHNPQKYANPDNVAVSTVISDAGMQEIPSPRRQIANGIPFDQVQCDAGKTLLVRHNTQKAVCVYGSSVERLVLRGFALVVQSAPEPAWTETFCPTAAAWTETFCPTDSGVTLSDRMITITNPQESIRGELGNVSFWPKYNVTFPENVRVGEPFDVVWDYAYVIPGDGGSYEEFKWQCDYCDMFHSFSATSPTYVDFEHELATVFSLNTTDYRHTPHRSWNTYHIDPPFDNTGPLQERFTFTVGEPDIPYRHGEIRIDLVDHNVRAHFFVDWNGTVHLTLLRNSFAGDPSQ